MSNILDIPTEELEKELERRRNEEERPQLKEDIQLEKVINIAENAVNRIVKGEYHPDNDDSHYIWEATMEALYGEDFFDWYNEKIG